MANVLDFLKATHHSVSARGALVGVGLKAGVGLGIDHHMKKNGSGLGARFVGGTVGGGVIGGAIAYSGAALANKYGDTRVYAGASNLVLSGTEGNKFGRAMQRTFTHGASLSSIMEQLQKHAASGSRDARTAWEILKREI